MVTFDQNAEDCGSCGHACGDDQFCFSGACYTYTCEDSGYCVLDAGYGECCGNDGLDCVDVESDANNCGGCGAACTAGMACVNGGCIADDCSPPSNAGLPCTNLAAGTYGSCCDGQCLSLEDDSNCGGCGRACPVGGSCTLSNYCVAGDDGGYVFCTSDGGNGGFPCPSGEFCNSQGWCVQGADSCTASTIGAACFTSDGSGQCCAQGCADLLDDHANCGSCDHACGASEWCDDGICTALPTCGATNSDTACPLGDGGAGACCDGTCADLHTDANACGRCGRSCGEGDVCVGGTCQQIDGGYQGCYELGCPAGLVCNSYGCDLPGCAPGQSGGACAFGNGAYGTSAEGTCCDGTCVDLNQDPENCGSCGKVCSSGICASSFFSMNPCFESDAGGGGTGCPFGCGNGTTCVGDQCVPTSCDQSPPGQECAANTGGLGICCQTFFSASCADISSDPQNCGGCGWACASGETCVNGACQGVPASCGSGRHGAFCELDAGTANVCCASGCADTLTDSANCGYCGNACYGGLVCVNGTCTALSCTAGTEEQPCAVDGGAGTCCSSSCVDLDNDPHNCGDCGHGCAGSTTCAHGGCGVDTCDASHAGAPCHLSDSQGLCCAAGCVDTDNDPANCGGCGLACDPGQVCSGGGCH